MIVNFDLRGLCALNVMLKLFGSFGVVSFYSELMQRMRSIGHYKCKVSYDIETE